MTCCRFIPPYLLDRVASADVDAEIARCGHATLAVDEALRSRRLTPPPIVGAEEHAFPVGEEDAWTVYTAENDSSLPGTPVRSAGETASGDAAVDEAYAGIEASVSLFAEEFGRDSYDGRGGPVVATVHYERAYDNAFWDGRQLVFGDGDGKVFDRFTKPVDVLAHEFAHAVTQYSTGFSYQGQSGALNESMSDVFAACVKQRLLGQSAEEADWLVGQGIFLPGVNARALRSMAEPGTAYDDPVIGSDPQVGHMSDYVDTREDNGGVHINSGIPNRAFYLAATRLGGASWERAGQIWYAALTGGGLDADTDFATFAQATVDAALNVYIGNRIAAVWEAVGVTPAGRSRREQPPALEPSPGVEDFVMVTRSGGFAGRVVNGVVSVAESDGDPRAPEVRALLDRIDLAAVRSTPAQPDRFVYTFCIHGGDEVRVLEQDLTPELSRLAAIVLEG